MLKPDITNLIKTLDSTLPDVDKEALIEDPEMGHFTFDMLHEGLKTNSDGWVDDGIAFTNPWGFDLSEIKVPVLLYQGTEDKMVPYSHGEWLSKNLPQEKVKLHLMQGQGHISLFLGQKDSMIDELLEMAN